ncbi:hypothetical protein [Lelliottia wanjuensis]|uniref:hypothetical protein n=1 Tax=Lelliottia wanjuensis TaxID=3050585 RepID=UPI00254C4708|nr:hypothetical protein [Lelliottia sp. V86_10]MDK9585007.1 hypothetical protein [Lelliottia sp. V86_10]
MPNNRDDFTPAIKRDLADRVGWICSYPQCGQSTIGPASESEAEKINNGIAAHICAAAPGGPRYDSSMSPAERKSISNGIWMCRNHGNLIDADDSNFSVEELKQWKKDAESAAYARLSYPIQSQSVGYSQRDINILVAYTDIFSYQYIQQLINEPFRAKVPVAVIDPLYNCMNLMGNPNYSFNAPDLEIIRKELNDKIIAFNTHFSKESGGNPTYYDYIDLNLIRQRNPNSVDYYVKYIENTQLLASCVGDVAMKLLNIRARL